MSKEVMDKIRKLKARRPAGGGGRLRGIFHQWKDPVGKFIRHVQVMAADFYLHFFRIRSPHPHDHEPLSGPGPHLGPRYIPEFTA